MLRLLAAVVGVTLVSSSAYAARPVKADKNAVLVLRVEGGGLPDDLVQKLDAIVRAEVKGAAKGAKLLPAPALEFEAMRMAAGCTDDGPECLAALGATLGAHDVIRVTISGAVPRQARVTVTTVRVKDKKARSNRIEIEDIDQGAIEEFRYQIAQALTDKKLTPPAGSLALVLPQEMTMEGIEIFLDDRKSPMAALKNLAPGEHTLSLHKEGFDTFAAKPIVRPARETPVQVLFTRARAPDAVAAKEDGHEAEVKGGVQEVEHREERTAEVKADPKAETQRIEIPVERPKEEKRLTVTWIMGGATAASLITASVFGILVLHEQARFNRMCLPLDAMGRCTMPAPDCNAGDPAQVCTAGRIASWGTYIAWPATGVFAILTALAFYQEGGFGDGQSSADPPQESVSVAPLIGGGAQAMFQSRF